MLRLGATFTLPTKSLLNIMQGSEIKYYPNLGVEISAPTPVLDLAVESTGNNFAV